MYNLNDKALTTFSLDLNEIVEEIVEGVAERLEERGITPGAEWLTVEGAAKHIGIDKERIYDAVNTGELQAYRPSPKCIRIDRTELDEWVRSHRST